VAARAVSLPRVPLSLGAVYGEAWELYRLLMRRSILTAFIVFAVVDGVAQLSGLPESTAARVLLGLMSFVLTFSGPVVVQGALIHIVRNVHEGRPPERIAALIREAGRRFWSLLGASILYGLGVLFGLLLLIVPGVIVAARWCLLAPLIMLEGQFVGAARERSADVVRGHTATAALIVVVTFVLTNMIFWPIAFVDLDPGIRFVLALAFSSVTAPFSAHVLTVLYYRLTDPERPVIHEDVRRWTSVWAGPTAEG
jgi:hypothetical protein